MNHHRNDKFHLAPKTDLYNTFPLLSPQTSSLSSSSSLLPACNINNGAVSSETNLGGGSNEILATSNHLDKFTLPRAPISTTSTTTSNSNSSDGGIDDGGKGSKSSREDSRNEYLCTDRKGFFDHLRPKSLILSTFRVTILQAAQLLATYLTDQLEHESKLDEQLNNDQITHLEYESSLLEFEESEWNKRWNELLYSNKLYLAIGKFHLLTFIIRCYEGLLWNVVKVDDKFMDKVTKDTYYVARSKSNELSEYRYMQRSSRRHNRTNTSNELQVKNDQVTSTYQLGKQMFTSCFYANAINFFADLTVQQCILLYGYYKFFISKERERKLLRLRKKYNEELKLDQGLDYNEVKQNDDDGDDEGDNDNDGGKEEKECDESDKATNEGSINALERNISEDASIAPWMEDEKAIIMLSFIMRSAQNTVMKAIGLVFASFGGAIGSVIYPGWGTLFGTQMGDAAISALLDE